MGPPPVPSVAVRSAWHSAPPVPPPPPSSSYGYTPNHALWAQERANRAKSVYASTDRLGVNFTACHQVPHKPGGTMIGVRHLHHFRTVIMRI